jgi:hypothetical protein
MAFERPAAPLNKTEGKKQALLGWESPPRASLYIDVE